MLQPAELTLEEMGDLADVIPAADPEVKLTYRPIPQFGQAPRRSIIPVCEPTLGGNEMKYVQQAIETNWISSAGRFIRDFEARFAEICGVKYGIACANGTVAMHLAMATLGLEPGDEVIIPTFTMIATANAVTYCGAKPVLVDMEPGYWQMDLNQVEARITPRTKAIVPVHIYGHPTDMDPLMALAEKHGIMVIEDAAEAHGAEYKGRRTGGLGHAAGFSFYGNKIITTGEGGMVTTNDRELAQLAWNLRDHAFSHERHFWHKFVGFNYRMTNLQAAVGVAQMERIDSLVARKRSIAARYLDQLAGIPGITLPAERTGYTNVYWMVSILAEPPFPLDRDALILALREQGIDSRPFFHPLDTLPPYFSPTPRPVSLRLSRIGVNLPSSPALNDAQVDYICATIRALASG